MAARSEDTPVRSLVTIVTGASSGFGQMIARDLAQAGHIVHASIRDVASVARAVVDVVSAPRARSR
ncbi:hypothetical protein [Rhizosaccharibacter radicis]|uniref:SDR family NAD(P)-dependent oxidoreductase n=1 Tax=Rhizosaccharibacter radicis TaxID=2782605 RepID=A0ABT1VUK4_9PROT|nr:hypothetical protein [Acetobacteraceae bacterium KSS12]